MMKLCSHASAKYIKMHFDRIDILTDICSYILSIFLSWSIKSTTYIPFEEKLLD